MRSEIVYEPLPYGHNFVGSLNPFSVVLLVGTVFIVLKNI